MNRFLYPYDAVEDVRTLRDQAAAFRAVGKISNWTSNGLSVTKLAQTVPQLDAFIEDCNEYLKQWDPVVIKANPNRSRQSRSCVKYAFSEHQI